MKELGHPQPCGTPPPWRPSAAVADAQFAACATVAPPVEVRPSVPRQRGGTSQCWHGLQRETAASNGEFSGSGWLMMAKWLIMVDNNMVDKMILVATANNGLKWLLLERLIAADDA